MGKENVVLKGETGSFKLIGKLKYNPNFIKLDNVSESGWVSNRASIGVEANGVTTYASISGGYWKDKNTILYCHGAKQVPGDKRMSDDFSEKIEVDWDERDDAELLSIIGPSCFTRIGLRTLKDGKRDVKQFLSGYDAVKYIANFINGLPEESKDDINVCVRGKLKYSYYQGKTTIDKEITSITLADLEKTPAEASWRQSIYTTKDDIGQKVDNNVVVTGHVLQYIGKQGSGVDAIEVKKTIPLPLQITFDITENSAKGILTKIHSSKNYSRILMKGTFGAIGGTQELDMSSLSPALLKAIEDGIITEEEITGQKAVSGHREEVMKYKGVEFITNTAQSCDDVWDPGVYKLAELDGVYDEYIALVKGEDEESVSEDDMDKLDFLDDKKPESPVDEDIDDLFA